MKERWLWICVGLWMIPQNINLISYPILQLCVYYEGKVVVDLCGVMDDTNGYDHDSITTVFSSSKVISYSCIIQGKNRFTQYFS